jgi:hypothetical protein
MKKLFCRLSSRRPFARLFSVLAVAIVAFAVATKAQADCDPFWDDCSGTGGSSWTGSNFTAVIKLGDYKIDIVTDSVCGAGYIDTVGNSNTQLGQTTACTLIENGVETPAQCQFSDLVCTCFKVPSGPLASPPTVCTGATITSTMVCPTLDPTSKLNEAGCTGIITVFDLNGNPLPSHPDPIIIGTGLSDLTNNGKCQQQFPDPLPGTTGLPKNVMGTLTQECTTLSAQQQIGRSTNGFAQTTQWFNPLTQATCNPADGFPTNACSNDSGANITFKAANSDQCVASNFSCGQLPDGSFGPNPSKCTLDKKSGLCQCRCDRCTPDGALVNTGTGNQGLFVVSSSDNVYACQVRVVH